MGYRSTCRAPPGPVVAQAHRPLVLAVALCERNRLDVAVQVVNMNANFKIGISLYIGSNGFKG
jgi:hypothetical protein